MIDLDALRADADFDGYAARMSIGELDALIAELRASRKAIVALACIAAWDEHPTAEVARAALSELGVVRATNPEYDADRVLGTDHSEIGYR